MLESLRVTVTHTLMELRRGERIVVPECAGRLLIAVFQSQILGYRYFPGKIDDYDCVTGELQLDESFESISLKACVFMA